MSTLTNAEGMRLPVLVGFGENIGKYSVYKTTGLLPHEYGIQVFQNDGGRTFVLQQKFLGAWSQPASVLDEAGLRKLLRFAQNPEQFEDSRHNLALIPDLGRQKSCDLGQNGLRHNIAILRTYKDKTDIVLGHHAFGIPTKERVTLPVEAVLRLESLLPEEQAIYFFFPKKPIHTLSLFTSST